ncbi:MAG TPA: OPT/YSL family transporter [Gemmataceae bacterium]|nr:OPT/YSL family transporter [Gemmataceae bacterium]
MVHVTKDEYPGVAPGRYLVDNQGHIKYRTDIPIDQKSSIMDNGNKAPEPFSAPQPQLFQLIIEGILSRNLEWGLVITGALIAVALELAGVSALPFAVGMYLALGTTTPIFVGGMLRWLADRARGKPASESESETSSGVLLSSGYIAGGTLIGLLIAFFQFLPEAFNKSLELDKYFGSGYTAENADAPKIVALIMFGVLAAILLAVGMQKSPELERESAVNETG